MSHVNVASSHTYSASMQRITSRWGWWHILSIFAAIWCFLPSVFALLLAFGKLWIWWPGPGLSIPGWSSEVKGQFLLGIGIAVSGTLVSALNMVHHVTWSPVSQYGVWRYVVTYFAIFAAFTLPASALVLPSENPNTGMGSPMGALISFVTFGVACFLFVWPVAVLLVVRTHLSDPSIAGHLKA